MSCNPCDDPVVSQVPGPQGPAGTNGTNGTDGVNAFTVTTDTFVMPAFAGSVTVDVEVSEWAGIGQIVFVENAGWMQVDARPSATQLTLINLETATDYTDNVPPTTVVPSASQISPGGLQGPSGIVPGTTFNSISPTTTKGDLIVDNGANSPSASDVRLGVGTNGQLLAAVSTQPTGVQWRTPIPVSGVDDNSLPRFNGTSGTPVPLQSSKMLITDDGTLQSTPTGGDARGSFAVDLQAGRSNSTEVASGATSTIAGGASNTASGVRSTVGGGQANVASAASGTVAGGLSNTASGGGGNSTVGGGTLNTSSGNGSTVGGGGQNTASGIAATVAGGSANTASGDYSGVAGGQVNTASGSYSGITGGIYATANKYGQIAHSSGRFAAAGDAQISEVLLRNSTTGAVAADLFLDGAAAWLTIPNNTTWQANGYIIARNSDGNNKTWSISVAIKNNGGVVSLVAAATITALFTDAGAFVTPTAIAGANTDLNIGVTGTAAKTIRWLCYLTILEVGL